MKSYNHKNKTINIRIGKDLDNKLQAYSEEKRITVSELTRSLLEDYFCDSNYVDNENELASV
jgi:hypothetical protein